MARHIDQSRTHRRGEGQDEVGQAEWCMSRLADQMHRAAQILRKNKDLCASVMSVEQGARASLIRKLRSRSARGRPAFSPTCGAQVLSNAVSRNSE
jgi:hypothetical protein